jgi:hypothetical protein
MEGEGEGEGSCVRCEQHGSGGAPRHAGAGKRLAGNSARAPRGACTSACTARSGRRCDVVCRLHERRAQAVEPGNVLHVVRGSDVEVCARETASAQEPHSRRTDRRRCRCGGHSAKHR